MAVRTRTKEIAAAAGGDARLEEYLDSKGVQWEFLPAVSADEIDLDKSLQNQARFEPLDEATVENYAAAMKRGDVFPPVVGYGKKNKITLADGNHRSQAAARAKTALGVYFVTNAPATTLVVMMYELNARHGKSTSEEERIHHALNLIENGVTIPIAAATLNLPTKVVEKASLQKAADQRFIEAGLPRITLEKLSEPIKRRLAQVNTDEGFVPLVQLTIAAAFSSAEVFQHVTAINHHRSAAKQVQYVEEQRQIYADRIGEAAGGTIGNRSKQGPKQRVGMVVSTLTNLPDSLEDIAKFYVGPERDEAAKRMRAAARKLNELARELSKTA